MNAAAIVTVVGSVLTLIGVAFTARATTRAAQATARANQAAAQAQVEPNQRAEDRAAFDAIKKELRDDLTATKQEIVRVRGVLYSVSRWALQLRDQVLDLGGTPQQTPDDVENYYRTGV